MNNNNIMGNLMQLMNMGGNPQQIIQNVVAQNPQLQQVFSQIGSNGMNAKNIALQLAQQQGIDLTPMVNFMQQRGMKL